METWTPDKIWEKLFASSPQIEWIHFRARIDYLPRKSLVFSFPGKEYYCLNLKPTLARGFKKWMTEKDSSSNVLIVKRERFTFLLSYFEPIIHEIGSYNNPENVDLGFTLENIAQTLNLPAFIAKDDSEQIAKDLSGQELVPGNHRYRLSRDVGCFVLEYVNEKKAIESYKIHRKTQPIGLSFQFKGIEKRFKTLAEFEEKMIEWKDLFGLISFEPVKLHLPETLDEDEESLLRWLKKIISNEDLVNQLYNKIVYQFGKETKQEVLVDPSIRKELTTWFKKKKKIHQGSEKQLSFEEFQGSLTYDDILEDENTSKVQTNQEQDTKDLKKEEIFVETTEEKIEKKVETTISQKLVENDELEPKNLLELEKEKEDLKREEEERERFQREEDEEREKRIKSSKIASQPSPPFSFSSPTAKRETFDTVDIEIETLESLWQTDILEGLTDKTEKFSVFVSTVEESEKLESKLQHAEHLLKLDITFDKNLPNTRLKLSHDKLQTLKILNCDNIESLNLPELKKFVYHTEKKSDKPFNLDFLKNQSKLQVLDLASLSYEITFLLNFSLPELLILLIDNANFSCKLDGVSFPKLRSLKYSGSYAFDVKGPCKFLLNADITNSTEQTINLIASLQPQKMEIAFYQGHPTFNATFNPINISHELFKLEITGKFIPVIAPLLINLSYFACSDISFNYLDTQTEFKNLQELQFRECSIQTLKSLGLSNQKFPQLSNLLIEYNHSKDFVFTSEDVPATVKKLYLVDCGLDSKVWYELKPVMRRLEELSLATNRRIDYLNSVTVAPNLKKLILNNCRIYKINTLFFSDFDNLTNLNLSNNVLSFVGPDFQKLRLLEELDISGNKGTLKSLINISPSIFRLWTYPVVKPIFNLKYDGDLGSSDEEYRQAFEEAWPKGISTVIEKVSDLRKNFFPPFSPLKDNIININNLEEFIHLYLKALAREYERSPKPITEKAVALSEALKEVYSVHNYANFFKVDYFERAIQIASENKYRFYFSEGASFVHQWILIKWFGQDVKDEKQWKPKSFWNKVLHSFIIYSPAFLFWFHFCLWIIVLALFSVIVTTNTSFNSYENYYFNDAIKRYFVGSSVISIPGVELTTVVPFSQINVISDFWGWVDGPLANSFYIQEAKNNASILPNFNVKIGALTFRQLRVNSVPCNYNFATSKCYPQYSLSTVQHQSVGNILFQNFPSWPTLNDEPSPLGNYYPIDGGLVVNIDTSSLNATETAINDLKNSNWIDDSTAVIFIDFVIYNPNLDRITSVELLLEFPPSGDIVPSYKFTVFSLSPFASKLGPLIAYLIIVFYFFSADAYSAITSAVHKRFIRGYFIDLWNWIDWLHFSCVIFLIGWHVNSLVLLNKLNFDFTTGQLLSNCSDCITLKELALIRRVELIPLGLLFLIYWAFLLKYTRIFKLFGTLFIAFRRMIVDTIVFLFLYLIITFAFAGALALLVGDDIVGYRTWGWSIISLLKVSFGGGDFNALIQINNRFALAYMFIYSLLSAILLLNLLIAMFSKTYQDVIDESTGEYQMEQYVILKLFSSWSLWKFFNLTFRKIFGIKEKRKRKSKNQTSVPNESETSIELNETNPLVIKE